MSRRPSLIIQRFPRIANHANFKLSLLLGGSTFLALSFLRLAPRHDNLKIAELAGPILSFTSMGFAIALAAVALILAMPYDRVTALLVVNTLNSRPIQVAEREGSLQLENVDEARPGVASDQEETAYLNLIAVFLITAFANVVASVMVLTWVAIVGGDDLLTVHLPENNVLTALVVSTTAYAGLQMLTAIKTLYEVSRVMQKVIYRRLMGSQSP